MMITLVMDQYGAISNGTTVAARHFAERLIEQGHTVRIVTCISGESDENIYVVKERSFLFFKKLIHSHGMVLAKPNKKVLKAAIEGADMVHFFMPFALSKAGKKIADKLGIASTAAFHLQPENVSYNVGMKFLTKFFYKNWRKFFNKFGHVHVPSDMIADCLKQYGYTAQIHSISNGVNEAFCKRPSTRPPELADKFLVMMSGRFGHEKLQEILIEAAAKSKYAGQVQVMLCGKGPREKYLRKMSDKLVKNPVIFKFCNREELIDTINYCDLYVHTSEIESEAIACMEAFTCGKVPVISDSQTSATKQFALHPQNLFQNRNADDLAQKIDWFIEHPEEKARMEEEYLKYANNFKIDLCLDELEEMFRLAIESNSCKAKSISAD